MLTTIHSVCATLLVVGLVIGCNKPSQTKQLVVETWESYQPEGIELVSTGVAIRDSFELVNDIRQRIGSTHPMIFAASMFTHDDGRQESIEYRRKVIVEFDGQVHSIDNGDTLWDVLVPLDVSEKPELVIVTLTLRDNLALKFATGHTVLIKKKTQYLTKSDDVVIHEETVVYPIKRLRNALGWTWNIR